MVRDRESQSQFTKLLHAIRENDGRPISQERAKDGADLIELLAYSGMRIGEARALKWQDVDFDRGLFTVTGGELKTKNYETRQVPISEELRALLLRLRAEQKPAPSDTVARIANPKKALETAVKRLRFPHFSPHNFRDFFATTCVEQGTDFRAVAGWLGHKDGGALLAKTYAHLRQSHSIEQMKRIRFGSIL